MKNNYKIRNFSDSNDGVAGVLVALLMVGLIISSIAFVQMVYVPKWMKEKEAEHMDLVATQFSQIKFSIDTLSLLEKKYSPISAPLTLGTKELPILTSTRAYGDVEILSDEFKISIDHNGYANSINYSIGGIKYTSRNAYYLNQIYTFEAGAVILAQDNGEVVYSKPSYYITNGHDLLFELTRIKGDIGKNVATGYGTYPIQMEFSDSQEIGFSDVSKITIINSHVKAWFKYFSDMFSGYSSLDSIVFTANGDGIEIIFVDTGNIADFPDLDINLVDINVQLSPGWIE